MATASAERLSKLRHLVTTSLRTDIRAPQQVTELPDAHRCVMAPSSLSVQRGFLNLQCARMRSREVCAERKLNE